MCMLEAIAQLHVPGNASMSLAHEVQLQSTIQFRSNTVEKLGGAVRLHITK